ncbi:MAG: iron-containing alcohol dehydrogenase family protein [bacterium]
MQSFQFYLPTRVYFGKGTIEKVGEEAKKLGKRALVVTGGKSARRMGALQKVEDCLNKMGVKTILFGEVEANPSLETIKRGTSLTKGEKCQIIVGLGGGSSMDVAKGIAVSSTNPGPFTQYLGRNKLKESPLPVIAIPTTAGTGSEVTPYAVFTTITGEKRRKRIMADPSIFPKVALVDPELTLSLPASVTADTGIDALSHAIEGLISNNSQPLSDCLALEAIKLLSTSLPEVVRNPQDIEIRGRVLYASLLAGMVIAQTGAILVHGMSYRLTSDLNLPHGRACAILLPWVCEFNLKGNSTKLTSLAKSLGEDIENLSQEEAVESVVNRIRDLVLQLGLPQDLKSGKIEESLIKDFANEMMQDKRKLANNPREVTLEDVIEIYRKALGVVK